MILLWDTEKYARKSHFETMKKLQRCNEMTICDYKFPWESITKEVAIFFLNICHLFIGVSFKRFLEKTVHLPSLYQSDTSFVFWQLQGKAKDKHCR